MRKLIFLGLVGLGVAAFVGFDAVGSAVGRARAAVRDEIVKDAPLATQLAEARTQIDRYAESIIRGEVAAERLADTIENVEREVRSLAVRVERGRESLLALRAQMDGATRVVATSTNGPAGREDRQALREVEAFRAASAMLDRRLSDLERLRADLSATLASLEEARAERVRLAEEARMLEAEIRSLEARKDAARTREAVGDDSVARSGFDTARQRLEAIRDTLREQNKLLRYYEVERDLDEPAPVSAGVLPLSSTDPATAIDEALAAYPDR